jgi:uncharacterized membrane protein YeaQ/YmgE (transglycosylase-associated protein family)
MSLFLWMVLGAAGGWLASHVMKDNSYGQMPEIMLGAAGAVAGGIITGLILGLNTASGINLETLAGSVLGGAIVIIASRVYKKRAGANA